jgi:hypothetical protein
VGHSKFGCAARSGRCRQGPRNRSKPSPKDLRIGRRPLPNPGDENVSLIELIEVELTEAVSLKRRKCFIVGTLKKLGVKIALDDFGTD